VIVLRMQIVIEEDGVVRARAQHLLCLRYIVSDLDEVAFESLGKPPMPANVVV